MTTPVEQFLYAEAQLTEARNKWNAMPTPEARVASGIDVNMYDKVAQHAARELVADAAGRHKIEEIAKVYLVLDTEGWRLDSISDDGYPFDGYDNGAINDACEHDEDDDPDAADAECRALVKAANYITLPTAPELLVILKEALD